MLHVMRVCCEHHGMLCSILACCDTSAVSYVCKLPMRAPHRMQKGIPSRLEASSKQKKSNKQSAAHVGCVYRPFVCCSQHNCPEKDDAATYVKQADRVAKHSSTHSGVNGYPAYSTHILAWAVHSKKRSGLDSSAPETLPRGFVCCTSPVHSEHWCQKAGSSNRPIQQPHQASSSIKHISACQLGIRAPPLGAMQASTMCVQPTLAVREQW